MGGDMGAFLCWMGVRLLEMHRVLADDGSIYLHIDHTAHTYVKTLMDAVFGRENFAMKSCGITGDGQPKDATFRECTTRYFATQKVINGLGINSTSHLLRPHSRRMAVRRHSTSSQQRGSEYVVKNR